MTDDGTTHYRGCWEWGPKHYNCAVHEIERLREALRVIAASSKVIAKGEDMTTAMQLLLTSHRETAYKALESENE